MSLRVSHKLHWFFYTLYIYPSPSLLFERNIESKWKDFDLNYLREERCKERKRGWFDRRSRLGEPSIVPSFKASLSLLSLSFFHSLSLSFFLSLSISHWIFDSMLSSNDSFFVQRSEKRTIYKRRNERKLLVNKRRRREFQYVFNTYIRYVYQ